MARSSSYSCKAICSQNFLFTAIFFLCSFYPLMSGGQEQASADIADIAVNADRAVNAANPANPPQLQSKFGIELSFTNGILISEGLKAGIATDRTDYNVLAVDLWALSLQEKCASPSRPAAEACKILAEKDRNDEKVYRVLYPDGHSFVLAADPLVVEVQADPMTLKEFQERQERVQRDLFDEAAMVVVPKSYHRPGSSRLPKFMLKMLEKIAPLKAQAKYEAQKVQAATLLLSSPEYVEHLKKIRQQFPYRGSKTHNTLRPHERIGGGHLHFDVQTTFGNLAADGTIELNPLLFRNFLVDYAQHPTLALLSLGTDPFNAPPIATLTLEQRAAFAQVIGEFDISSPQWSAKQLAQEITDRVYYATQKKPSKLYPTAWVPARKYQAVNLTRFVENTEPQRWTMELRGLRPESSGANLIKTMQLFSQRIQYLRSLSAPIPFEQAVDAKFPIKISFNPKKNKISRARTLAEFKNYIEGAGGNMQDYLSLLPQTMLSYIKQQQKQEKKNQKQQAALAAKAEGACANAAAEGGGNPFRKFKNMLRALIKKKN